MGSSNSSESNDSDVCMGCPSVAINQKYNKNVPMTLFDLGDRPKIYEIVAIIHPEKPGCLYFVLLGDHCFGFCLTIDDDEEGLARPSFEYKLNYQDPRYFLSFITNGTLERFTEILNLTVDYKYVDHNDPVYNAKNLFRIEGWDVLNPNEEHVKKIEDFFKRRGIAPVVVALEDL